MRHASWEWVGTYMFYLRIMVIFNILAKLVKTMPTGGFDKCI